MNKNKPIVLIDPYPRTMDILFSKKNFDYLDKNFTLIKVPKKNKKFFYNKYLPLAKYIIGQPDLPTELISKQKILKGIFNVESNFMDNMDYDYCFKKNIHILATSPVFAQPVAEMALGLTLSIARSIHIAHNDFIKGNEKYGGEIIERISHNDVEEDLAERSNTVKMINQRFDPASAANLFVQKILHPKSMQITIDKLIKTKRVNKLPPREENDNSTDFEVYELRLIQPSIDELPKIKTQGEFVDIAMKNFEIFAGK